MPPYLTAALPGRVPRGDARPPHGAASAASSTKPPPVWRYLRPSLLNDTVKCRRVSLYLMGECDMPDDVSSTMTFVMGITDYQHSQQRSAPGA